uniref:Secreted protein n=1 Tax=Amphiprion ocellaris TaxID=80972 RepID=A0AAQ6AL55_AMPOC
MIKLSPSCCLGLIFSISSPLMLTRMIWLVQLDRPGSRQVTAITATSSVTCIVLSRDNSGHKPSFHLKKKTLLTCRKLQSAASHRRTKLLHHHHAVFMERPLQQSHDSHTCRETGLHQLCYRLNSKEKNSCAHHLLPCWSV